MKLHTLIRVVWWNFLHIPYCMKYIGGEDSAMAVSVNDFARKVWCLEPKHEFCCHDRVLGHSLYYCIIVMINKKWAWDYQIREGGITSSFVFHPTYKCSDWSIVYFEVSIYPYFVKLSYRMAWKSMQFDWLIQSAYITYSVECNMNQEIKVLH